jgi:hypothetical protein
VRRITRSGRALTLLLSFILWLPGVGAAADSPEQVACQTTLSQHIPPRTDSAMTGSEFVQYVAGMTYRQRETAMLEQLRQGNLPAFLRTLQPVRLRGRSDNGRSLSATICVMPDYLALGSDDDFLRVPLTRYAAMAIAAQFDFFLPTPKIVDAIYAQSDYHLKPKPMQPGPQMRSTAYYLSHQRTIENQRRMLQAPLGSLLAGHKKDVVLTNRLTQKPDSVAIYGWHRRTGRPIQPLSTAHGSHYADYSHGVRLISNTVWIAGQAWSAQDVLRHSHLAWVLSREGPLASPPLHQSAAMVLQQRKPR